MGASSKRKDDLEEQANAAAAEAARVARDEVLSEGGDAKASVKKLEKIGKEAAASAKAKWVDFMVDVWLTDFNAIEFGFWKRDRNRGKSRQFTADMDIFAEVTDSDGKVEVLGYRRELWTDNEGTKKRLVFKLFTENLGWRASMDLMLGRSVQQTIGSRGFPVTTYCLNTHDDDFLVYLERSAYKWPLMPENFSFFTLDGNTPRFYRIKRNFISIGGDYTLFDESGEAVGHLDGAIFTLGGRWDGSVRADHADKRVLTVMKMFAGLIVFNRAAKRHIKRLARDIGNGSVSADLQRQESDLYQNPRRIR